MIIGFAGRKGAGKDTAARVFVASGWDHMKMAGALKAMLHSLLAYQGLDDDLIFRMLEGDLKEVDTPFLGGHSPRHAMKTLGTEWGREHMGEDFWVQIFMNSVDGKDVVCSDVRFPNEVEAIQERGGQVFRISRPGTVVDDHPSEALIDELDVDAEIENHADSAPEFARDIALLMGPRHRA